MEEGERGNANDGYGGEDSNALMTSGGIQFMDEPSLLFLRKRLRKRHETFNGRIKHFKVLSTTFHHSLEKHSSCFQACCVLTQVAFNMGLRKPFSVDDWASLAVAAADESSTAIQMYAHKKIAEADAALAKSKK